MRQIVVTKYGAPEVLQLRAVATQAPGPGHVRIRIRAAGVNFADVLARMGVYADAPKLPFVPGYEVAGDVDAVGAGVTTFVDGDHVLALTRFGGYAEFVIAPVSQVFRVPPGMRDHEAAAVPVSYLTAALALDTLAHVAAGETVLVYSAGGGVGIAATQLAHARGAAIIGAASSHKHQALRALGVEFVIDPGSTDLETQVRRITKGRGADIVLDPNGGTSFARSYRMLAPLGRLIMYGMSSAVPGERRNWLRILWTVRRMPSFGPLSLINKNRGIFGLNLAHLWDEQHQLRTLMEMLLGEFRAGRLQPIVSRTYPLAEAPAAHRFVQSRQNVGKVVLTSSRDSRP
jgi:synaptic vesicle membrane protein VAT-1